MRIHSGAPAMYSSLLLVTCLSAPLPAQKAKSAGDYWPLKVGNNWTLATQINGKTVDQLVTVTKVTPGKGGFVATLDYTSGGRKVQTETYQVTASAMLRLTSAGGGSAKLDPPLPMIRFPLAVGRSWKWDGRITTPQGSLNASSTLSASGPFAIKTPAGTFQAMKVHSELVLKQGAQTMSVPNDYWFAPGVGLVQQSLTVSNTRILGQLKKYQVKK